jgi:hypothetical protein
MDSSPARETNSTIKQEESHMSPKTHRARNQPLALVVTLLVCALVAAHIEANTVNGIYSITDARTGTDLALTFAEVHAGAHPVDSGETYHCADFTDAGGKLYDLDFYVGAREGKQEVVEVLIHQVDGVERLR